MHRSSADALRDHGVSHTLMNQCPDVVEVARAEPYSGTDAGSRESLHYERSGGGGRDHDEWLLGDFPERYFRPASYRVCLMHEGVGLWLVNHGSLQPGRQVVIHDGKLYPPVEQGLLEFRLAPFDEVNVNVWAIGVPKLRMRSPPGADRCRRPLGLLLAVDHQVAEAAQI